MNIKSRVIFDSNYIFCLNRHINLLQSILFVVTNKKYGRRLVGDLFSRMFNYPSASTLITKMNVDSDTDPYRYFNSLFFEDFRLGVGKISEELLVSNEKLKLLANYMYYTAGQHEHIHYMRNDLNSFFNHILKRLKNSSRMCKKNNKNQRVTVIFDYHDDWRAVLNSRNIQHGYLLLQDPPINFIYQRFDGPNDPWFAQIKSRIEHNNDEILVINVKKSFPFLADNCHAWGKLFELGADLDCIINKTADLNVNMIFDKNVGELDTHLLCEDTPFRFINCVRHNDSSTVGTLYYDTNTIIGYALQVCLEKKHVEIKGEHPEFSAVMFGVDNNEMFNTSFDYIDKDYTKNLVLINLN